VAFNTTSYVSGGAIRQILSGQVMDLHGTTGGPPFTDADAVWAALFGNTITNNPDNDETYSATGETSGTGYTAGGKRVQEPKITVVSAANRVCFSDDLLVGQNVMTWGPGATITPFGALYYNATRSNIVLASIYFGNPAGRAVTNGTFTLTPDPLYGIFSFGY